MLVALLCALSCRFSPGFGKRVDRYAWRLSCANHHSFLFGKCLRRCRKSFRRIDRDLDDAVPIGCDEVARLNVNPANVHRHVVGNGMNVSVRNKGFLRPERKTHLLGFFQAPTPPRR